MVDEIVTISRSKLGECVSAGVLAAVDMIRLNRAIAVFLGLASTG